MPMLNSESVDPPPDSSLSGMAMVNLEVGVATGFQFDKWKKNVTEMGRISDVEGRYGWFVPKDLESKFPFLQSWKVKKKVNSRLFLLFFLL